MCLKVWSVMIPPPQSQFFLPWSWSNLWQLTESAHTLLNLDGHNTVKIDHDDFGLCAEEHDIAVILRTEEEARQKPVQAIKQVIRVLINATRYRSNLTKNFAVKSATLLDGFEQQPSGIVGNVCNPPSLFQKGNRILAVKTAKAAKIWHTCIYSIIRYVRGVFVRVFRLLGNAMFKLLLSLPRKHRTRPQLRERKRKQ